MNRKINLLVFLALCAMLGLGGCRRNAVEIATETETQSETVTEKETAKPTEKLTEKQTETQAPTEKTTTVPKTSVQPSTQKSTNNTASTNTANQTNAANTGATQQCPYCYQQISTAPDGNGSTIYDTHVAQEKAWAELNGYGDPTTATTPATEPAQTPTESEAQAPEQTDPNSGDIAQCGYCYQWFTVSDGTYAAHLESENAALGMPEGTEYITCPICGYAFPKGSMYDNHVHVTE